MYVCDCVQAKQLEDRSTKRCVAMNKKKTIRRTKLIRRNTIEGATVDSKVKSKAKFVLS